MKRILPLVLAFAIAAPSATANDHIASPADFSKKLPFTVSGYTGASTLENFPVLVRLSTAISGFSYELFKDSAGADLLFTDAEGNAIPHEIETWDTAGESLVWVRVPALSGTTTTFAMYFGSDDPGIGSAEDVWARYAVVVHGGASLTNAVAGGPAVTAGSASVAANAAAGKVGGGVRKSEFNAVGVNAANVSPALASNGKFSVSAWFKRSSGSGKGNGTHVLASSRTGWNEGSGFLWLNEQDSHIAVAAPNSHQWTSGNGKLAEGVWAHVAFAYESGASLTSYFNGAQDNRKTSGLGNLANASGPWTFGSYANTASGDSFKGDMDELRVYDGVASGDWIKAEYDSTDDPASFAVAGAVVPADPTAPVLDAPAIVRNADGTYTVTVVLSENGGAVGVIYDAGATAVTNIIDAAATPGTYTNAPANLANGTTYRVSAYGKGASGTEVVEKGGVLYNGSLAFGATTDADEATLAAGGVVVSRAAADPWPLAVSYTIAGPAGSAGTTWAAPAPVEIPAGSASATLPVVPLRDDDVNADIEVTVALAAGNYGRPEPNAASLTLVNRHVVEPLDFAKKIVATPSAAALAKIGDATWADFPVLVRLPAEASALLRSADGTDLLVTDEDGAALPFEVETFDPAGTTFVWVKVPSLSADTEITVHFGGAANADNDPAAVWTRYVGVWHFDDDAAGTTTVPDATGHALDGTTTGTMTAVEGPFGAPCLGSSDAVKAPDYEPQFSVGASFTASGWFKLPSKNTGSSDYVSFVKKKGGTWNAANGWYLEMDQGSKTTLKVILTGSTPNATIKDVTQNWQWFQLVSDGSTVKVYVDGTQKISSNYKIVANSEPYLISAAKGQSDEYRLRKGAASAAETALEYATMADAAFFDYGAIRDMDPTAPAIAVPVIARDAATGAFTVTALVSENVPTAVFCDADGVTNAMATADAGLPMTYSATLSGLAADTTYACAVGAGSTGGTVTSKACPTAFYNGDLSVAKVSDAIENGLVPGVFRISRADTAHDLVVAYTVGGTAIAGQTYEALSGTATIPAGSNSVDIAVAPLIDAQTTSNTTVSVTLAAGLYGVDAQAGSAELTVVNLVAPAGFNVWVAPAAGLASAGSNWSEGHCPTASEAVLFDGRFSTADCEWDAAASATVASWTQASDYTGAVTFKTTFAEADAAFTSLTIAGDAVLDGGKWTLPTATSAQTSPLYRIKATIGGSLTVAAGASIDVSGKAPWTTESGGSYGGQCDFTPAYGNVLEPAAPGQSHKTPGGASGDNAHPAFGGGAVWLEVAGATALDGSISANGLIHWGWDAYCGSGGGIYLKTAALSGSGTITADGNSTGGSNGGSAGAGGRISILLTDDSEMDLPLGNVHALGSAEYAHTGGAGTVVVRTTSLPNGRLVVRNLPAYGQYKYYPPKERTTPVLAGETWTFDEVVFGANGVLRVPAGATLALPNGLASVSGSTALGANTGFCGILLDGGALAIPDTAATEHVVGNGPWMLSPNSRLALDGSLAVQGGAAVGAIRLRNTATNAFTKMDLAVKGDMTVASDGYILAEGAGLTGGGAAVFAGTEYGAHGGSHGATGAAAAPVDGGYGSILSPALPGNSGSGTFRYGSGVALLEVGGALTLDGTASANAIGGHWYGAAGTIRITAGSLAGSGKITANGHAGAQWDADNNYHLYPGGGRVAVRLTGAGATFSGYWTSNIQARGVAYMGGGGTDQRLHHTSAGTVYLQDGKQGEGHGTVRVFQNNATVNWTTVCTNDFTAYPSTRHGGESDDLRGVALEIGGGAHVLVSVDRARADSLSIAEHSTLNLHGRTLAVTSCRVCGVNVQPGKYTAGSTYAIGDGTLGDYVVDTADGAGGTLIVRGSATLLILR